MVAGAAAVPARATDMNGLVVTMANYLESCVSGRGIQFTAWCFLFTGNASASTTFGWEIDYGATPAGNTVDPVATGFEWSGFALSTSLALRATRETANGKTITVNIPIVGTGTTSLAISKPGGYTMTFTASSWTLRLPSSFATFTFRLGEGNTFPDWPDVDVDAAMEFGNFTVDIGVGYGYNDEDVNGNAVGRFANPDATIEIGAEFGDHTFTFEALWARVNNAGVTNAYGFNAEAELGFGNFSLTLGVAHSINDDLEGNYEYDIVAGDRIWSVWGEIVAAWNDMHQTTLGVTTAWSNVLANSFHYEVTLSHRFRPYGDSSLSITPRAWYQHALDGGGAGIDAWGLGLTIAVPINM
jgi:hypothetical protein